MTILLHLPRTRSCWNSRLLIQAEDLPKRKQNSSSSHLAKLIAVAPVSTAVAVSAWSYRNNLSNCTVVKWKGQLYLGKARRSLSLLSLVCQLQRIIPNHYQPHSRARPRLSHQLTL